MSYIKSGPVVASEISPTSRRAGVAVQVKSTRTFPVMFDVMSSPRGRNVAIEMYQAVDGRWYQMFDVVLPSGAVIHVYAGSAGSWVSLRDIDGKYVGNVGVDPEGRRYPDASAS